MWLINTNTLKLESFVDERQTKYAILSHRWTEEEVTFQKFSSDDPKATSAVQKLKGFSKIEECCRQALKDGLQYAWVDTCCIDKSSSAELQEAINSMFSYYQKAEVCYAFLSDVTADDSDSFVSSQSFTRGWTLQELIAPRHMIFIDAHWRSLGDRVDLAHDIKEACGVSFDILQRGWDSVNRPCIAKIMSWASRRSTTRIEDRAYSLLGLFDVNMPLLYGEGEKAFRRLQEEILRSTEDQTIFAWEGVNVESPSLLATSPDQFPKRIRMQMSDGLRRRKPHMVTNEGILLEADLWLIRPRTYLVPLSGETYDPVCIALKKIDNDDRYARIPGWMLHSSFADLIIPDAIGIYPNRWRVHQKMITVVRRLRQEEKKRYYLDEALSFKAGKDSVFCQPNFLTSLMPYEDSSDVASSSINYFGAFKSDPLMSRRLESSPWVIGVEHYFPGPVAIMKMKPCAIRYGLLGFDKNLVPVCVISTRFIREGTLSHRTIERLFIGNEDPDSYSSSDWSCGFDFDDGRSSPKEILTEVLAIHHGTYEQLTSGVFKFTASESASMLGLVACILVKPILPTFGSDHELGASNGPNTQSTLEAMLYISLKVERDNIGSPWKAGLEVYNTNDPSGKSQCWTRFRGARRVIYSGPTRFFSDSDPGSDSNSGGISAHGISNDAISRGRDIRGFSGIV